MTAPFISVYFAIGLKIGPGTESKKLNFNVIIIR